MVVVVRVGWGVSVVVGADSTLPLIPSWGTLVEALGLYLKIGIHQNITRPGVGALVRAYRSGTGRPFWNEIIALERDDRSGTRLSFWN